MAERLRTPRVLVGGALGAVVVAVGALVLVYALRVHGFVLFDEYFTGVGGRYVESHLPHSLWDTSQFFVRGPERLTALLAALTNQVGPSSADDIRLWHATQAGAFALTVVPAYGLARTVGTERGWALGAAVATVCVPWLVFGVTLLNSSLALLTSTAGLWAMVVAVVRGGWRADAVALGALVVMAVARVSLGGLGAALVVGVVVQAVRDQAELGWTVARARAVADELLRRHTLVLLAVLAVLVIAATGRLDDLAGGYGASFDFHAKVLLDRAGTELAQLSIGFTFVPVAGGLAWLLRGAVAPGDRAAGALGVVGVAALLTLTYINRIGTIEDRYLLPIVALAPVGFAAALSRRELPRVLTVVLAVVAARAIAVYGTFGGTDPFAHFYAPTADWFSQVWIGRTRSLPIVEANALTFLMLLGIAACVTVVLAPERARRLLGAGALLVSVVVGLAAGVWGMNGLTGALPYRQSDLAQATFVDRATDGAETAVVSYESIPDPAVPNSYSRLQLFNRSVRASLGFGVRPGFRCCPGFNEPRDLRIDPQSGSFAVTPRGQPVPRYLIGIQQWTPAFLAVEPVATSTDISDPVRVERVLQPPRVAWVSSGAEPDGWGVPGRRLSLRVFRRGLPDGLAPAAACLHVNVVAPSAPATGMLRYRIASTRAALAPSTSQTLLVPLGALATQPAVDLPLVARRAGRSDDGRAVTARLYDVRVQPCG